MINRKLARYIEGFPSMVKGFDFETLEKSKHSVFALSPQLKIIYINPAWVRFAEENGKSILKKSPLGISYRESLKGDKIKDFYINNYNRALATGEVWYHEYECSSKEKYRLYNQGTFPLKNGKGLIVINTQVEKLPMSQTNRQPSEFPHDRYIQPSGFIDMCSNCRHVKRNDEDVWDWVPEWLENSPEKLSHTICPTCFDYYWKYSNVKFRAQE